MKSKHMKIGAVVVVIALIAVGAYLFAGGSEGKKIEYMGTVVEDGAKTGLVIPAYVADEYGIATIADLNDHVDKFGGEIIGIDSGAGIMSSTEKAITEYGLNFNLIVSSEAGMLSTLGEKYEGGKAVVVTLWEPHWIMGSDEYDLVFLEDTELVYGEFESILSYGRNGLAEEDPVLADIMAGYAFEQEDFASLLAYIEASSANAENAAAEWVDSRQDLLDAWLGDVDRDVDRGKVKIGLVSWACAIGSSNALKHVLEEAGYSVTLTYLDVGPMYEGLYRSSIDLTVTVWSPLTHEAYLDRYAEQDEAVPA